MDKSLIMMRNRIGPSLVPWGTPALTGSQSGNAYPIFTRCLQSERKLMIHGIRHRLTPISNRLLPVHKCKYKIVFMITVGK